MKKLLTIIALASLLNSCDNKRSLPISRTANKTGKIISLSSYKDTLVLGDTLGIEFKLPNPVLLDDGSVINIKKVIGSPIGYSVDKSFSPPFNKFYLAEAFVERNKSLINDGPGRFYFNPQLMPLLGTIIHYVPKDTGTYVLYTERNQSLTCTTQEDKGNVLINLFPDFDVPDIHNSLLDSFPISQEGRIEGKTKYGIPYYVFYVMPK